MENKANLKSNLLERDAKVVWHPFSPVKGGYQLRGVEAANGLYLTLENGEKIIDGISSWWVNNLGHSHPEIVQTISDQAKLLTHTIFAGFTHEPAVRLAEKVLHFLPNQEKVFFSDNGSTSVEVAIKIALQYWKNIDQNNRTKVIAFEGAYHGDTFGAMSVGERGSFNLPFEDYMFDVTFLPFPFPGTEDSIIGQFERLVAENDIAAFIFEPLIQGAAGMRIYDRIILDELLHIARSNGVICIADEVFTGFYRTGKRFACDHLEQEPDIFCLSKGLTGGNLPLSLTTVSSRVFEVFNNDAIQKAFYHGHSYTGNPLACAVANKVIDILERKEMKDSIHRISVWQQLFVSKIKSLPAVINAQALGTILAIELRNDQETGYFNPLKERIYEHFIKKGILLRPLGNVLYFIPPYIINEVELNLVHHEIYNFVNELDVSI